MKIILQKEVDKAKKLQLGVDLIKTYPGSKVAENVAGTTFNDAGYAADSTPKAGLASLTLDVMDEGTTTRDTFRIADELGPTAYYPGSELYQL